MRGRKYKRKVSALIVTSKECPLTKSGNNIPGLDIISVDNLTAELLAPGCDAGRLTLWTKDAVEKISKENMFM